ncbi:uncharacterized protein FOMMEDRAFT_152781 [Fomitiporia mediterranea MF3/22]|uniref:uncharacterized protein n=1 Tax=Fomitiporia mediterranea (strain MF3/22) TaxID=694068 RepID=UPI00044095ED|nr:uncharacterized protein FOMMEDRAFT_152781 [Fomitiporia mediterranea MF3/22]EJD05470.1 hypothetical protein FOMMEDRAFT_152781 [Fomitiporia mediterranea MF3/22]
MTAIPSKFYALVDRDSIYDSLFDFCTPATIFRVARTCRLAHAAMLDYTSRVFDINKHYLRFFNDPFSFRVLQARTHAIVSGSSALQFMDRTVYEKSDLDIFVTNRCAAEICAWIVKCGGRGYRFVPTEKQIEKGIITAAIALRMHREQQTHRGDIDEGVALLDFYDSNRLRSVLNYVSTDGENRKVQVIVTYNTAMEGILSFHSTVVMNLITHFGAYSLYPKGTFERRLLLPCETHEVNRDPGIEKYLSRGWGVASRRATTYSAQRKPIFPLGKRFVGDHATWTIHFDDVEDVLKCVTDNSLKADPITLNTFSFVKTSPSTVEMRFSIIKPPFFESRYTACPEIVPKMRFWFAVLRQMLECTEESISHRSLPLLWFDWILVLWITALMGECTCIPSTARTNYPTCPAFITGFYQYSVVARQHLKQIMAIDEA